MPDKYIEEGASCACTADGSCACSMGAAHPPGENHTPFIVRLVIALAATLALTLAFPDMTPLARTAAYGAAYFLAGYEVLLMAFRNIQKGKVFDENFLMSVASIAAFAIGDMPEAIAVMIFYGVGEILEERAVARSRRNIGELMDIRPDFANLKEGQDVRRVSPEEVTPGQIIVVRPGEKIPLDGVILSGRSHADTKALTGESVPRTLEEGAKVYAGFVNLDGLVEIGVEKSFGESTVSKILALVENAADKKAKSEQFITKFARYYTPAVVFIALGVALLPPLLGFGPFADWIYKGVSFLIISCPCALVISIPVGFFGGIGGAARNGILVKGGNYLEAINGMTTLVFDKTGTLTEGIFKVTRVLPAPGVSREELLRTAATAEVLSNHPIARSVVAAYGKALEAPRDLQEKPGYGITATTREGLVFAGNRRLMETVGIEGAQDLEGTTVHVARGGTYLGCLLISDQTREGTAEALRKLREGGIRRMVMLTGDNREIAERLARELGLDEYRAELLPQDKVAAFEEIQAGMPKGARIAFVGDGINDAPVLARADIGIAMGGMGSDAAIEAADVVIMNDDIQSVWRARKVAAKTRAVVLQNIVFALGVKALIMVLAFLGITSIWFAIFADVGVALLAILNAVRALYVRF